VLSSAARLSAAQFDRHLGFTGDHQPVDAYLFAMTSQAVSPAQSDDESRWLLLARRSAGHGTHFIVVLVDIFRKLDTMSRMDPQVFPVA
jgi:hypothetical protein